MNRLIDKVSYRVSPYRTEKFSKTKQNKHQKHMRIFKCNTQDNYSIFPKKQNLIGPVVMLGHTITDI